MANDMLDPGFDEFVLQRSSSLYRTAVLLTRDPHDAQDLLPLHFGPSVHFLATSPVARGASDRSAAGASRARTTCRLTRRPRRRHTGCRSPERRDCGIASAQRAVIVLRYFHDYTEAQTAEAMQIAVGTVKSQHAKALSALRISDHLADDEHSAVAEGRGVQ